ncbi:l1 transposable element-related [Holotrichia oblita]|uniref:L1 transposable element-related n=1 Tax=Holotrichia oblita TaxID=644536 RepID=A0ACB9SNJ8_HOLOL|nr:l1 transposable element-related [Holotrichia oblita]
MTNKLLSSTYELSEHARVENPKVRKEKLKEVVDGGLYRKEVQVLTEKVVQLEAELITTRSEVRKSVDDLEQYSRRNNLRIFGVPEEANEDTKVLVSKFCKDKLKFNVGPELMDACHRLPAKEQQQRPIIVKFHDRATKANVCSKKQELRGTKFVIREDLTRTRHFLMVEAKKKYGNRSVWSNNVVAETWLDNAIPNESLHIQGYLVVRKDRVTRGGGVCIYIRESLLVVPLSCSTSIEQAWVGVEIGCTKLALDVFYKPPNFHYKLFCDYLEEQVTTVSMEYDCMMHCTRKYQGKLICKFRDNMHFVGAG